jgi:steroid delta-isomerase-like uncharacterized protein
MAGQACSDNGVNTVTFEDNKQFMQRFVEEVINKKNVDAINQFVAEDFVEHVPFPGQGPGREGLKQAISTFLSAFPDIQWILEEQIAEGQKVVSCFTMTGTHHGEFLGIPPAGKLVNVRGVVIDVVKDGKLAESRIIMDTPGLMQQLGTIPSSEGA